MARAGVAPYTGDLTDRDSMLRAAEGAGVRLSAESAAQKPPTAEQVIAAVRRVLKRKAR